MIDLVILTGITADKKILEIMDQTRLLADGVFSLKEKDTLDISMLLKKYDVCVFELEKHLIKGLKRPLLADSTVYDGLKSRVGDEIKLGELLAGVHDYKKSLAIVKLLEGALGSDDTYVKRIKSLVQSMQKGQWLVLWSLGEERADEILATM